MDELPEHFKTLKNKLALPLHSLCIRHHKTKSVNPFLIEPRLELDILTDLGEQMRFLKTCGEFPHGSMKHLTPSLIM